MPTSRVATSRCTVATSCAVDASAHSCSILAIWSSVTGGPSSSFIWSMVSSADFALASASDNRPLSLTRRSSGSPTVATSASRTTPASAFTGEDRSLVLVALTTASRSKPMTLASQRAAVSGLENRLARRSLTSSATPGFFVRVSPSTVRTAAFGFPVLPRWDSHRMTAWLPSSWLIATWTNRTSAPSGAPRHNVATALTPFRPATPSTVPSRASLSASVTRDLPFPFRPRSSVCGSMTCVHPSGVDAFQFEWMVTVDMAGCFAPLFHVGRCGLAMRA